MKKVLLVAFLMVMSVLGCTARAEQEIVPTKAVAPTATPHVVKSQQSSSLVPPTKQVHRSQVVPTLVPTPIPAPLPLPESILPKEALAFENLVANGSFENPDVGARWRSFSSRRGMPGWTVEGSVNVTGPVWHAAHSRQTLDLNGSSFGTISQSIPTVERETYYLLFALSGNPDGGESLKAMEVWWDSKILDTVSFDTTGRSGTNMGWVWKSYEVVAVSSSSLLKFRSLRGGSHWGVALDAIQVRGPKAIPGPTPTQAPPPTPSAHAMPTVTPTPPPTSTPTPTSPSSPRLVVRGNEIALLGEVSSGESLWPGVFHVFPLFIGGCGCDRSVDIRFSPKQGKVRTEVRLQTIAGPVVREGKPFKVPNSGIRIFVLVWADPGTSPFWVDTVTVEMKQSGGRVDLVEVARDLSVPESLAGSLDFYNFSEQRGVVFGAVQIKNLGQKPQTVSSFAIKDCSSLVLSGIQFFDGAKEVNPKQKVEVRAGDTLLMRVQIGVPAGEVVSLGEFSCQFSFKRALQRHTFSPTTQELVPVR